MSISRRNDGRYVVKFKDGTKWKQKTFRAREDAEGFERSTQYDKPGNTRLTVSESILLFLSRTKHAKKGEKAYARTLERIGDEIATKYVDTLDRRDLENVRNILEREWKMSAKGINRATQMLKAAFRWCAAEDFICEVPWDKYHYLPEPQLRHLCGDFEVFRKVYALCSHPLQWAIRTCLALCLRPGKELINLCWKQIDFKAGTASVFMYKTNREKTVFALPGGSKKPKRALCQPKRRILSVHHLKGKNTMDCASSGTMCGRRQALKTCPCTLSATWLPA